MVSPDIVRTRKDVEKFGELLLAPEVNVGICDAPARSLPLLQ